MIGYLFLALSLLASRAQAQELPFLNPNAAKAVGVTSEITAVGGPLSVDESRAGFSAPVYVGERSIWNLTARAQSIRLGQALPLADRGVDVPKHFGGADFGLAAQFPRENSNQGFSASIGSTGRRLFHDGNARAVTATYFHEWKLPSGNARYFLLSYSNNRTLLNGIPIPGFAYAFIKPTYRLIVGAPFFMWMWSPDPWRVQFFASPFSSAVQTAYVVRGPWQIQGSLGWYPRSFQNIVPDEDGERLLFDKKEWSLGGAFQPAPPISISLSYVYDFDRRLFAGQSVGKRRSGAVEIADAGGLQFKLRMAF